MQRVPRIFRAVVTVVSMALSAALLDPGMAFAQAPQSKFADVNGVRLHYLVAGKGDPVVLVATSVGDLLKCDAAKLYALDLNA